MLEKVPYQPKRAPSKEAARAYIPKFIYRNPDIEYVNIKEEFYGTRRRLRIGILGAGMSTLNFLHYLQERIPADTVEVVVYEQNHDVGGVWLTHRYPGCRCDTPGPQFQFSWRLNIWSEYYPRAEETCEYLQSVARENGFYQFMKFQHKVVQASWSDDEAKWTLKVEDLASGTGFEEKFDVFLEADGPISIPRITIPGIENFSGKVMHSSKWDEKVDLNGKKVALFGYGSSGVQIAPNIVNEVSTLYTWFRNKTFVLPPWAHEHAATNGYNFKYTEEQKKLLADPDIYRAYLRELDDASNRKLPGMINGSVGSEMLTGMVKQFMREKLAPKPALYESLVSDDFAPFCRRPTLNHGYLEAVADPKTTVFLREPKRWTPKGFVDADEVEHEVDIVIAATGFQWPFKDHAPKNPKTVNGEDLAKRWACRESPPMYMAMMCEGTPNYFHSSTIYAPVYRSWYQLSEATTKYMVKVIDKMQLENVVSFKPKTIAVDHFVKHCNAFAQRVVMSGPCAAWVKRRDGGSAVWPGGHSHYMQVLENPRFEDFDMVYEDEDDMFSYMGNGFCLDPDADDDLDQAWYIEKPKKEVSAKILEILRGVHGDIRPPPNVITPAKQVNGTI